MQQKAKQNMMGKCSPSDSASVNSKQSSRKSEAEDDFQVSKSDIFIKNADLIF